MAKKIHTYLLAAAMSAAAVTTGCTVHAAYYDPYYHDYHPRSGEVVFYSRWESQTHRQHVDLDHRSKKEQKEYWDWRHKQNDQQDGHR